MRSCHAGGGKPGRGRRRERMASERRKTARRVSSKEDQATAPWHLSGVSTVPRPTAPFGTPRHAPTPGVY